MYKTIRKKVGESVSRVDSPEHYEWNKWLREPESDEYSIDSIFSAVLDTENLNVWPSLPSTKGYTFDLPKVRYSKAFKQLHIKKNKSSKIFFSFPNSTLQDIEEILNPADIDYAISVSESGKGAIFRLSEGKNKKSSNGSAGVLIREFYLMIPGVFNFPMLVPEEKVYPVDVRLVDKVETLDLLSNLKSKVINVELLNSANLIDTENKIQTNNISFQPLPQSSSVKKVEIVQLEDILHSINEQKKLVNRVAFTQLIASDIPSEIKVSSAVKNKLKIMSVKNIRINSPKIKRGLKITDKVLSDTSEYTFKTKQKEKTGEIKNILNKDLEVILQPTIKFSNEEKEKLYNFLYDHEKPAADFLAERDLALLNDPLGTGKTLDAIGALRILFERKDISDAIIVCRKEDKGWVKRNKVLSDKSLSGWYDHFQKFSPETTVSIIYDNSEHEWQNSSSVKIIDYELFTEALEKKLISLNELNRRGCLIIDEAEDFPEIKLNPLPRYLWLLSGLSSESLKHKLSIITGSDDSVANFARSKEELADSLQSRMKQDYWIQMDPDQKLEYEKALESGREKIYDLVQAGNPFLVQSNVFTLIHQLTQIGNFKGDKETSTKSELLLHHVKSIQESGKKVLVYSQYDRQGTQRLEKLFAKNGIKYVLYQTGISLKEMENAVKSFAKDKSITVFLAGMKAISAKLNLSNVDYLIHFDQWWSPPTTWQAEDKINFGTDRRNNRKLSIYNYFIKNSIDEQIQLKLIEKGLNNKSLFDLLSSEGMYSLITNEDWLEVLELIEPQDPESIQKARDSYLDYLSKLTMDDFAHKVKALAGRIGYKNASFKTATDPNEIRIYASSMKNTGEVKAAIQCLDMKVVPKKIVKEFADSLVLNTDKIFVFTTGVFDDKLINNPGDDRITLIDKHQVSNYLNLFNLV